MKEKIQTLQNIVSRKGSTKILSFSIPHVFKALQYLHQEPFVSRKNFEKEIHIGAGAVKTLISHLKQEEMVDSTRSGTFLTKKGLEFTKKILNVLPRECVLPKSSAFLGKYNHAILIKNYSSRIKTGIEQRDYAIMYGAIGCTTLIFYKNRCTFPGDQKNCLINNKDIEKIILEKLCPENGDVILVTSASNLFVAEISAKNSALWTLASF